MGRSAQGSSLKLLSPRKNPPQPDQIPEPRENDPVRAGQINSLAPQITGARQFHAPEHHTHELQNE